MNKRQLFKGVFATIAVSGSAAALFHLSPLIDHNELPDDARIEMEEDLALGKGDRLVRTPSPGSTPTIADKGPRLPSFAREETLNVPLPQPKPVLPEVQPTTSPIANPPIPVPRPKDLNADAPRGKAREKIVQDPAAPRTKDVTEKPAAPELKAPSIFRRAAGSVLFVHTHTGEKLAVDFRNVDTKAFDYFMRDFRRNEVKHISEQLVTRFGRVVQTLRTGGADIDRMDLISGYRSEATNAMLQNTRGGQASNSQHIYGRAMDIRAGGVRLSVLHKAACAVARAEGFGGVGYYPKQTSNFVHIDVASLRFWGI